MTPKKTGGYGTSFLYVPALKKRGVDIRSPNQAHRGGVLTFPLGPTLNPPTDDLCRNTRWVGFGVLKKKVGPRERPKSCRD